MSDVKTIKGSGYGSVYVDSLVAGGRVWDNATGSVQYWFGNSGDKQDALLAHGESKKDSTGNYYLLDHTDPFVNWENTNFWFDDEKLPFSNAMSQFSNVANISFTSADEYSDANLVYWQVVGFPKYSYTDSERPADPNVAGHSQSWAYIDATTNGTFDLLQPGQFGFAASLHMIGIMVGLAQPQDGGWESDRNTFPGVREDMPYDLGLNGMNQAPFTAMSSNFNLQGYSQPDGEWGSMKTLGALDIAALQAMYGANMNHATGNDTYELSNKNAKGAGWTSVWDAGGVDTISGQTSTKAVTIDLRAATLADNDPHAGGYISQAQTIAGGITIAKGAVIENAVGSAQDDTLTGNEVANNLSGGAGNDILNGLGGNDVMDGGLGNDVYYVDSLGDLVIDSGGIDTVYATVAFNPGAGIENFYLNGVKQTAVGTATNPVVLPGTKGKDALVGGVGVDRLAGGLGNDKLTGGPGQDTFVFNAKLNKKTNLDTITDFSVKDDTIELAKSVFKKIPKKGFMKKDYFFVGKEAHDKNDFIVYDKKKGALYYDADGNGDSPAIQFAKIAKNLKLKANDFKVV